MLLKPKDIELRDFYIYYRQGFQKEKFTFMCKTMTHLMIILKLIPPKKLITVWIVCIKLANPLTWVVAWRLIWTLTEDPSSCKKGSAVLQL